MIFHANCLACEVVSYFFQKLGMMLQNLSSAAVVIGALRVNIQGINWVALRFTWVLPRFS